MATAEAPVTQRRRALEQANRVRSARARVKHDITSGMVSVAEVVERRPDELATMTIGELLRSQPGWGPTRCSRLLRSLDISEGRTLGALTERQRRQLVTQLRG
jgi:S13-like protein